MQGSFGSDTCRAGVKSGESTIREIAAYMLDHEGFSGVPPTALVEINHESLQAKTITEEQVSSREHLALISGLIKITRGTDNFDRKKSENIPFNDQHSTSTESTVFSENLFNNNH